MLSWADIMRRLSEQALRVWRVTSQRDAITRSKPSIAESRRSVKHPRATSSPRDAFSVCAQLEFTVISEPVARELPRSAAEGRSFRFRIYGLEKKTVTLPISQSPRHIS